MLFTLTSVPVVAALVLLEHRDAFIDMRNDLHDRGGVSAVNWSVIEMSMHFYGPLGHGVNAY